MWHANNGSVDCAAKIFQRALKAIPGNKIFSRVQLLAHIWIFIPLFNAFYQEVCIWYSGLPKELITYSEDVEGSLGNK
jgi:hypothetical protein